MQKLIIFTRYPTPGRSKTRLIPKLGAEGACALHRRLAEDTIERLQQAYATTSLVTVEVHYTGADTDAMRRWLGGSLPLCAQSEGDLGARLSYAMQKSLDAGCSAVLIVGTDAPGLDVEHIEQAFSRLQGTDLVLGPATDGGYYLIGLSRPIDEIFDSISWGTELVLKQTIARAHANGVSWSQLAPLADIDRPDDLTLIQDKWPALIA